MTEQSVDQTQEVHGSSPVAEDGSTYVRERRVVQAPAEDDAAPETGSTEVLRSTRAIRAEHRASMVERYGGFYWGADFLGFAVAVFFLVVFLGIVGGIVGAVGFQLHAPVPKVGGSLSDTQVNLGIGALVGSLIALFLAYFIGGYAAGRMARFDGVRNGIGVVIWTVIAAVILGIAGAVAGTQFNVANQLHLNVDTGTVTLAGVISLLVALIVALIAASLGGSVGERYHRAIDRDAEDL